MRTILASVLAVVVASSACSSGDSQTGSDSDPTGDDRRADTVELSDDDIQLVAELVPFESCDLLLEHIKREATDRVGPYGLDYYGYGPWIAEGGFVEAEQEAFATEATSDADSGAAASDDAGGEGGSGGDFTGTNVQELGVDEPDIIKTDGDRLIAITENRLSYVDLGNGDPALTDQLTLDGWNHELFFDGDRVLVFTNGGSWGDPVPYDDVAVDDTFDAEAGFAAEPLPAEPGWYGPAANITEIDISDPDDLEITATLRVQGEYLSARRVDGTIRLALTSPPSELPWVYPSGPSGEERAEETNRELIADTTIDDWIPGYELSTADGETSGPLFDCTRLHRPAAFSGFDVVSVLSFDLDDGLDNGAGAGVLASGRTIYASTDRFYVATTEWAEAEMVDDSDVAIWEESYGTDIHAFSITPDEPADYLASGTVSGTLLNQFSMDEHEGYLRIITTDGTPWSDRNQSESKLTVLTEDGDELVQVGQVGGLGKGETLYSARLLDEVGFAVTFRQIDPFYVLDLRDPTDPQITGELKIPGFSTYLHPLGDDLVLGIGQDATEEGRTLGLKVSLFDVREPTDPRELATWTMRDANSPAEHDHRAFQYLPDQRTAILPVQQWAGDFNGAVLLEIGDETITEIGRVTHVKPTDEPTSDCDVLDPELFPEESELFWVTAEGGRMQYCEPGASGGYGDWFCEPWPLDELRYWGPEEQMQEALATIAGEDPDPDARIEMCWPNHGNWHLQVQRSLVIDGDLWTMSQHRLQANELATLEAVASLDL